MVGIPKCFPGRSCQFRARPQSLADTQYLSVRWSILYELEGLRASRFVVVSLLACEFAQGLALCLRVPVCGKAARVFTPGVA